MKCTHDETKAKAKAKKQSNKTKTTEAAGTKNYQPERPPLATASQKAKQKLANKQKGSPEKPSL